MSMYFEGYWEARRLVKEMDEPELLDYLDNLYGRTNLPRDYTLSELRQEALDQCKKEFTDYHSPQYQRIQNLKKAVELMRKGY